MNRNEAKGKFNDTDMTTRVQSRVPKKVQKSLDFVMGDFKNRHFWSAPFMTFIDISNRLAVIPFFTF